MNLLELANAYTEAWSSGDPARVAALYTPGGTIAVNGDPATPIAEVAAAFLAQFPDMEVFNEGVEARDDGTVEFRWTFTGTSSETGKSVRIPGNEDWTLAPDGLIAESRGSYDEAEFDRQVQHGA